MKQIVLILTLIFSLQASANCLPKYEQAFAKTLKHKQTTARVGKIATGTAFVTVGGFYGVMGVIMLGPLWAGAITGTLFGTVAALPVGTTFILIHQGQKARLKKLGRMMSVLQGGEEFDVLLANIQKEWPELTEAELSLRLEHMNQTESLCNGEMARVGKLASVKDIKRIILEQRESLRLN